MEALDLYQLLFLVALFVFVAIYFLMKITFVKNVEVDEIDTLKERAGIITYSTAQLTRDYGEEWWAKLGVSLAPRNEKELDKIHQKLVQAGMKDAKYIGGFYFIRLTLALSVALACLILWTFNLLPSFIALLVPLLAYILPEKILNYLASNRLNKISTSMPDYLDMVNVCINAGLSWMVSIKRVSEELSSLHPEICYEFDYFQEQVQIGVPRIEALRQLAERNPVNDIEQLVSILIQNERLGSPVSESLAIFSKRMYDEREEMMSEKAAKASAKMALVIMPFLLIPYVVLFIGEKMVMLGRGF